MRRVVWTQEAADDFSEQLYYVSARSPDNALLIADRVMTAVAGLADFPSGHPGRKEGIFEKVVQRTSLIVAYRLTDQEIKIMRIIHGARNWTSKKWPEN